MIDGLKIIKVYVVDGRQKFFDFLDYDGSVVTKVSKRQMLNIYEECDFVNASVFRGDILRVDRSVIRERITTHEKKSNSIVYIGNIYWGGKQLYRLSMSKYELPIGNCEVFNAVGDVVNDYEIKDLYGVYTDETGKLVYLHAFTKEYWDLYKYLCFIGEHKTSYRIGAYIPGRNTGCELKDDNYYFLFDSAGRSSDYKDTFTLGGILVNTDYWSIDGDILTVHCHCYAVKYKIKDTREFNKLLAKLRLLKKQK